MEGENGAYRGCANVLDWMEAVGSEMAGETLVARALHRPDRFDAYLASPEGPLDENALLGGSGEGPVAEGMAWARADGRLLVRAPDAHLAAVGERAEGDARDPFRLGEIAAGERWLINFADPNATKALHVGHLRGLAVGQAIAGMAEAAGADVIRQSRVGDFGRNMGEAMAGYARFGGEATPEDAGEKSDHFVGRLYAKYVDGCGAEEMDDASDPLGEGNRSLTRERHIVDDLAERCLRRWLEGEEESRDLLRRVRSWAVGGQDLTLARLGIVMDRTIYESDYLEEAGELLRAGLSAGVVERAGSGATVFPTGDPEFPFLLLTRADEFPTQHLRYIGTWYALASSLEGYHTVGVLGAEWGPLSKYTERILEAVPPFAAHPAFTIIHGMVVSRDGVIKSSRGGDHLLDGLLDDLVSAPQVCDLCDAHPHLRGEDVARLIALGFYLPKPTQARLEFSSDMLFDTNASAGWCWAQAWAKAWDPGHSGRPDPEPQDPAYRFVVIRSQVLRRMLERGLRAYEVDAVAKYLFHLSRWFLRADVRPREARVMRRVLAEALGALGLPQPLPSEEGTPEGGVVAQGRAPANA
jgi:arginyl-tRNA synthetase